MKKYLPTAVAVISLLSPLSVAAIDKSEVRKKWHTPFDLYLSAREAYEMKTGNPDKVIFIDVRTRPEIHYIGMADQVDANIPYHFDSTEWRTKSDGVHGYFRKKRNPDFEAAMENALSSRGLEKTSPVIIMCTSGSRAPYAARALHKAGFTKVYTQVEGFEGIKATSGEHKGKRLVAGWKFEGLPWSYDFVATKMYFNFDPKVFRATEHAVDPSN
jgi:rhodanese-related sulfurtransferase